MLLRAGEIEQEVARLARSTGDRPRGAMHASLRAVVLLAGAVRSSRFRRSVNRFVLELPVEPTLTIFDGWQIQLTHLARFIGVDPLAVRVMIDPTAVQPATSSWPSPLQLQIERDPLQYRGTGGLLSDIARQYDSHDYLLVADAAQVSFEPIALMVDAMAASGGDITILTRPDGSPRGLMLMRCGALTQIAPVGYVDLKEQALPRLKESFSVQVVQHAGSSSFPIRTLSEYIGALREYHRRSRGQGGAGPFGEDWWPTFGLVEPGAQVHPSAVLHDSVVLAGGQVDRHAVVVRSVVCRGGVVDVKRDAVDCCVGRNGSLMGG